MLFDIFILLLKKLMFDFLKAAFKNYLDFLKAAFKKLANST